MALQSFYPEVVICRFVCSTAVLGLPHHSEAVIWLFLRQGLLCLSLVQLLHSGTSITDCPEKVAAIRWFQNVFSSCGSVVYLFVLLPPGPKLSCPTEAVMNSRYWFSLSVPDSGVVHPVTSSSAMGEAAWVVVSIKSCPSTGSDGMQLNRVVGGHWLVALRWITPKLCPTSQWLKVTCSHTVSLSSTTLPAKGWRSGLLSRLNFFHSILQPSCIGNC